MVEKLEVVPEQVEPTVLASQETPSVPPPTEYYNEVTGETTLIPPVAPVDSFEGVDWSTAVVSEPTIPIPGSGVLIEPRVPSYEPQPAETPITPLVPGVTELGHGDTGLWGAENQPEWIKTPSNIVPTTTPTIPIPTQINKPYTPPTEKELFENTQFVLHGSGWQERLKKEYGDAIKPGALVDKDIDYLLRNGYINEAGIASEKGRAAGLPVVTAQSMAVTPQDMVNGKYWGVLNEDAKRVLRPVEMPYDNKMLTSENVGKQLRTHNTLIMIQNEARGIINNKGGVEVFGNISKWGTGDDNPLTNMFIKYPWLTAKDLEEMKHIYNESEQEIIQAFKDKVKEQIDEYNNKQRTLGEIDRNVLDYLGIKYTPDVKPVGILKDAKKISSVKDIPEDEKNVLVKIISKFLDLFNNQVGAGSTYFKGWEVGTQDWGGKEVKIVTWLYGGDYYGIAYGENNQPVGYFMPNPDKTAIELPRNWEKSTYQNPIDWNKVTDCTTNKCTDLNLNIKDAVTYIAKNGFPKENEIIAPIVVPEISEYASVFNVINSDNIKNPLANKVFAGDNGNYSVLILGQPG